MELDTTSHMRIGHFLAEHMVQRIALQDIFSQVLRHRLWRVGHHIGVLQVLGAAKVLNELGIHGIGRHLRHRRIATLGQLHIDHRGDQ